MSDQIRTVNMLEKVALRFLHAPYLWGGRSPLGIDCSGFTQVLYKCLGIAIPRDAYQQADIGKTVNFAEEATLGDLAFFQNETGKITHVGMILKDKKIIHSSAMVRIDTFDHFGIFNADTNKYSHQLKIIKRIL
jgi:cell wall-associated NlpC family hydrolase